MAETAVPEDWIRVKARTTEKGLVFADPVDDPKSTILWPKDRQLDATRPETGSEWEVTVTSNAKGRLVEQARRIAWVRVRARITHEKGIVFADPIDDLKNTILWPKDKQPGAVRPEPDSEWEVTVKSNEKGKVVDGVRPVPWIRVKARTTERGLVFADPVDDPKNTILWPKDTQPGSTRPERGSEWEVTVTSNVKGRVVQSVRPVQWVRVVTRITDKGLVFADPVDDPKHTILWPKSTQPGTSRPEEDSVWEVTFETTLKGRVVTDVRAPPVVSWIRVKARTTEKGLVFADPVDDPKSTILWPKDRQLDATRPETGSEWEVTVTSNAKGRLVEQVRRCL